MDLVGADIRKKIKEIGKLWKESPSNPTTSVDVINYWNNVMIEWVKNKEMPLIIRRPKDKRGHVYIHETGREIIISDNTPATWVMYHVLDKKKLPLHEIRQLLEQKEIPIALALTRIEKEGAKHTKTQGEFALSDWKVCHIEEIGLNKRGDIEHIDINLLEKHFVNFLSPKNMFLIPKSIAGLGEVQEFIDEQR